MNYRDYLERHGVDTFDGAGSDNFLANCPFHDDNKPSLEVHVRKGIYYCFGCKATGSFPALFAEIENISLTEAQRLLMTEDTAESVLSDLHSMFDELAEEPAPIKYYSIDSFHHKFPPLDSSKVGALYVSGRRLYKEHWGEFDLRWGVDSMWKNRVIIPIYTDAGKLLTYAGRSVFPKTFPKTRKVKGRSPRTTLYGLSVLLNKYKNKKLPYVVLTEGEFDAMYLQTYGIPAVASMGTMGLTGDQIYLMRKYAKSVVFSYDGDPAGWGAQERGLKKVRGYMPAYHVDLPKGSDPNELSQQQVERLYRGYFL